MYMAVPHYMTVVISREAYLSSGLLWDSISTRLGPPVARLASMLEQSEDVKTTSLRLPLPVSQYPQLGYLRVRVELLRLSLFMKLKLSLVISWLISARPSMAYRPSIAYSRQGQQSLCAFASLRCANGEDALFESQGRYHRRQPTAHDKRCPSQTKSPQDRFAAHQVIYPDDILGSKAKYGLASGYPNQDKKSCGVVVCLKDLGQIVGNGAGSPSLPASLLRRQGPRADWRPVQRLDNENRTLNPCLCYCQYVSPCRAVAYLSFWRKNGYDWHCALVLNSLQNGREAVPSTIQSSSVFSYYKAIRAYFI
ncbi:hypothetical protein HBI47_239110 [Parastagonospora nodorum]|nr:hypothetical protein HBI47_239110 [Parastagonospora nodorum]